MSKVGSKPINIADNVNVTLSKDSIEATGPVGSLSLSIPRGILVEKNNNQLIIKSTKTSSYANAIFGLSRTLIANAVYGVSQGWTKTLEIVGTGYRVKSQGDDLVFEVGFSHSVIFKQIPGVKFATKGNNIVTVIGVNKELVGRVAHQIRCIRKPDVYKGKGIRYEGEFIKLKPGKKVVTGSA